MRGKGYTTAAESEENRITPAYAGKSRKVIISWQRFQDHPRLCGEKFSGISSTSFGSGITPAYAGKSVPVDPRRLSSGDHPRLCGEKPVCGDVLAWV